MPKTARFSSRFYNKLGDDVATELVEWFNTLDSSYRSEFRDLFDGGFARVDAKLGQVAAEIRVESEQRYAVLVSRIERLDADVDVRLGRLETRLIRWMFVFWMGSIGSMLAMLRFWLDAR